MHKDNSRNNKNKLFDVEKSTRTFMYLMSKYRNQKRKIKESKNNRGYIIKTIDDKKRELEREEKEEIFIYKEAKNTAYINQELLNSFGIKAKSKEYDTSKIHAPLKLGKKKFFDPTQNNIKSNSSTKLLKKGYIELPLIPKSILNYNKKPLLTYNNSINYKTIKNNSNKNIIPAFTDYSIDSNKKSNFNSPLKNNNESNFETETNICPSSFRNSISDKNILMTEVLKNKITKKNKDKMKKYIYLSNRDIFSYNGSYLNRLSNFKDLLIREERQKRNYFYRNDYGCNLFKEKYAFLNKKYFESN